MSVVTNKIIESEAIMGTLKMYCGLHFQWFIITRECILLRTLGIDKGEVTSKNK
jgi:hypothetical protein